VRGLCPDPCGVYEREGKKGGLKEGERWSGPPRFMTDRHHYYGKRKICEDHTSIT